MSRKNRNRILFTRKQLRDKGYEEVSPDLFARGKISKKRTKISKKRDQKARKCVKIDLFVQLVKAETGLDIISEHRFHPDRKWRFDYASPDHMIAIEVEGGIWTQGRHTRGQGYLGDMKKYNAANATGWRLIRVTPQQLLTNETINQIKQLI